MKSFMAFMMAASCSSEKVKASMEGESLDWERRRADWERGRHGDGETEGRGEGETEGRESFRMRKALSRKVASRF
jgi:hypothetical protein